jgi:3-oxoacyl-[acyl-carrier protein] reductase
MLTSVIEAGVSVGAYPELAGKRILITGMELDSGVDLARGFAEQGCRIVLHTTATGEESDAVLEMLACTASELQVYNEPLDTMDSAVRFAQMAAKTYGGLDAVINLVKLNLSCGDRVASVDSIERAMADQLQNACLMTRIAANRMRLMWSEGLILNVAVCPAPTSARETALLSIARTMLASMTRTEAQEWADQAIRINAVAPCTNALLSDPCLTSEPDVAALALYLAGGHGAELSGIVFDLGQSAALRRAA